MINHKNNEKGNLSKILLKEYPSLTYSELKVLLRKKDVKIDGKRVNVDVKLMGGEEIIVYNKDKEIKVVFEDENKRQDLNNLMHPIIKKIIHQINPFLQILQEIP